MMNSLIQWYMKKYFQGGNSWGMQPWMGNMFNNKWGTGNPEGTANDTPQGNTGFNFFNPGNQQFPFPPWIQELIRQQGFPFSSGQGAQVQGQGQKNSPGSSRSPNSGAPFNFYPDGFNPFAMFQPPSSNNPTHNPTRNPSRNPTYKDFTRSERQQKGRQSPSQHPKLAQQPTRFKPDWK